LIQADASDRTRVEGATGLPPGAAGRAVEEYLAVLDDAAFGAATEVMPKIIAPSDPATRWTAAHRGPAFFVYSANYLIDAENVLTLCPVPEVDPTQWKIRYPMISTGMGTPRSHKSPYFI
jgi:hypothetical protein